MKNIFPDKIIGTYFLFMFFKRLFLTQNTIATDLIF